MNALRHEISLTEYVDKGRATLRVVRPRPFRWARRSRRRDIINAELRAIRSEIESILDRQLPLLGSGEI